VEKHLEILDLVKELNETFKQVVFFNFLLSSLLLCVLGFQLVTIESFAGRIVPATFGVSVAIQLFAIYDCKTTITYQDPIRILHCKPANIRVCDELCWLADDDVEVFPLKKLRGSPHFLVCN
jgi:hypothetical protein